MCVGVYLALTFDIDTDDVHLAALAARVYDAAHTRITLALDMRHRVHTSYARIVLSDIYSCYVYTRHTASMCCSVCMPSRSQRVCYTSTDSASHFLRDRSVTHTRSYVSPLHPQLAFCSTCCRAGSHCRALALTLHAHNLPNASCVTGTARGSLRCVCACECIACVCVWVCTAMQHHSHRRTED